MNLRQSLDKGAGFWYYVGNNNETARSVIEWSMRVMSEEVHEMVAEYNVAYQREFGRVGISWIVNARWGKAR